MQLAGFTYPKYVSSFIGNAHSVIGYLVSVIRFYLQFPEFYVPNILLVLCRALIALAAPHRKTQKTTSLGDRADSAVRRRPKVDKSEIKASSLVRAMDGRRVLLEISFGEGSYYHRTAIAWVKKPRAGEPLPTETFVISPPDENYGRESYLVQVPDEQLSDFEKVENRKGVYRLTSVLYVEDSVSEEMFCE